MKWLSWSLAIFLTMSVLAVTDGPDPRVIEDPDPIPRKVCAAATDNCIIIDDGSPF